MWNNGERSSSSMKFVARRPKHACTIIVEAVPTNE